MTTPLRPPPENLDQKSWQARIQEISRWMYEVYRRMKDTSLLSILWSGIVRTFETTAISAGMTADIIQVTAPCNVTLPTAVGKEGHTLVIDNAQTGAVQVLPFGTETIEGETTQTITGQASFTVYSDGYNWRLL